MPQACATAAASSIARLAMRASGGRLATPPMVSPVRPLVADIATFNISFRHFSVRMDALASVGRPCSVSSAASASALCERPPDISPINVGNAA